MRSGAIALWLWLLAVTSLAQNPPVPAEQEPFHAPIFRNEHVQALRVEIPPHQATEIHQHAHQYLTVALSDTTVTSDLPGLPPAQEVRRRGDVWMDAPVAHAVRNDGNAPFRATVVSFFARQGEVRPLVRRPTRYCNPHSQTACVTETYLFCTDRVCVSEVEMGPGAITLRHSHSTAHMVIAVSDLEMKDWIQGYPSATMRVQRSGEVLFMDAGITHQLENGPNPARMIVVSWR